MNMDVVAVATLLFAALYGATAALHWSATPADGETIHACANRDITIPWAYSTGPGETVTSIRWTFRGRSQMLIAASVQGSFLATPSFGNRVSNVSEAGLLLRHVTLGDTGDYMVSVIGYNSAGDSFVENRNVYLQVAESLMTTDHDLHAVQQSAVQYSGSTDQWHAVLSCGNFTYTDDPPISVEWVTPDGTVEQSTFYKDGFFHYFLSNPVKEGDYMCRIPDSLLSSSCASTNDSHTASVTVDGTQTRIVVMEAGNVALKQTLRGLTDRVTSLERENSNLTDKLAAVQRENDNLTQIVQQLNAEKNPPHVAFRAKMSGLQTLESGGTLVLPNVTLNAGHAYDPATGVFTAPVTGVYYFSAMAAPAQSDHSANVILESNTTEHYLFGSWAYKEGEHAQTGSGQTAIHLQKGDQVWLVRFGDGTSFQTADPTIFTGFLLYSE